MPSHSGDGLVSPTVAAGLWGGQRWARRVESWNIEEQRPRARVEELQGQIDELKQQLRVAEEQLTRLCIARETGTRSSPGAARMQVWVWMWMWC
ncbi:hypothetical protein GCM10010388_69140 [Streptomyces mauvecolor]